MKKFGRKVAFSAIALTAAVTCLFLGSTVQAEGAVGAVGTDVSPYEVVRHLDLSCHAVDGGTTPVRSLTIGHLNPVLRRMGFDEERAYLYELDQMCVPVAKNQKIPPQPALDILRWLDLACYSARGTQSNPVTLRLEHLNPVLREMGLPAIQAAMARLEQVCVPVAKDGVKPPAEVLRIIEHVDVACYQIDPMSVSPTFPLHLTHLNPVCRRKGLREQDILARLPEQLCVPVMKNGRRPPNDVLQLVEWIDFLKFQAYPRTSTPSIPLKLNHLNPQFANYAAFEIRMNEVEQLAVPVAKNGIIPKD